MKKQGVYVGRFNPIHKGHERIIQEMLQVCGVENSVLVIGSSNNATSLRHFFTYEERRSFILAAFPEVRIVGLPDYFLDKDWLTALDDILRFGGIDPASAVYFGGCEEDLRFFLDDGRHCRVIERFEGELQDVSATRVRDGLIHDRKDELAELLSPRVLELITQRFREKWETFKRI